MIPGILPREVLGVPEIADLEQAPDRWAFELRSDAWQERIGDMQLRVDLLRGQRLVFAALVIVAVQRLKPGAHGAGSRFQV